MITDRESFEIVSKPKMDETARRLLEAEVEERPSATLSERREYLGRVSGLWVSESTLSSNAACEHHRSGPRAMLGGGGFHDQGGLRGLPAGGPGAFAGTWASCGDGQP